MGKGLIKERRTKKRKGTMTRLLAQCKSLCVRIAAHVITIFVGQLLNNIRIS